VQQRVFYTTCQSNSPARVFVRHATSIYHRLQVGFLLHASSGTILDNGHSDWISASSRSDTTTTNPSWVVRVKWSPPFSPCFCVWTDLLLLLTHYYWLLDLMVPVLPKSAFFFSIPKTREPCFVLDAWTRGEDDGRTVPQYFLCLLPVSNSAHGIIALDDDDNPFGHPQTSLEKEGVNHKRTKRSNHKSDPNPGSRTK
jgi:hypothetical protein